MTDTAPAPTPAVPAPPPTPPLLERLIAPSVWLVVLAWAYVVVHFAGNWSTIGAVFHDADDMMRLAEVRDYLAGQGWYDLHQYRLDPPAAQPMHWSRLVDWPIAALVRLAATFVAEPLAEKVAMFVWPLLTLIPVLVAAERCAVRLGGRWAALPAVYLLATLPQSIGQFVPGRIDHHNVQIGLTLILLAVLALPWGLRRSIAAGLVSAAMLAVGLETVPFQIIAAVAFAVRYVTVPAAAPEIIAWGTALALATFGFGVATLPAAEWLRGACDALSPNWIALAVVGGLGLALAARARLATTRARILALAAVAVVAIAAYAAPEPRCLAGPFAQVPADVRKMWLDRVSEVEPWTRFFDGHPSAGILALVMPALGLLAAVLLARRPELRRAPGFWPVAAAAVVTLVIGLTQLRTLIYANALAVPLVAAAIGRFAEDGARIGRSIPASVLGGIVVANSILPSILLDRLAPASWREPDEIVNATADTTSPDTAAPGPDRTAVDGVDSRCFTIAAWKALAALPPGLVAAEIDLGPVILVATPHSVVAAPYHRMLRGLRDVDVMLSAPPPKALARITERGVDYVAACTTAKIVPEPGGLLAELLAGRLANDFEELKGDPTVRVFRRVSHAYAFTAH